MKALAKRAPRLNAKNNLIWFIFSFTNLKILIIIIKLHLSKLEIHKISVSQQPCELELLKI